MASAKVDTLGDSASDAWEHVQSARAPAGEEGKRQARRLLHETADPLQEVQRRVSDKTADLSKGLIGYTKTNPLTALLLAGGACVLVFGASRILQSRRYAIHESSRVRPRPSVSEITPDNIS